MDLINPFDVFSVAQLSDAITVMPNMYGRLNEENLFPVKGINTDIVAIEYKNGVLSLLPSHARGAPGPVGNIGKRDVRTFKIPQITYDEGIEADEVLRLRAFGQQGLESLDNLVNEKLANAKRRHDITLEYMRSGALLGVVKDGDGTVVFNYYTEFGIAEKVIDFVFTNAATDVRGKCMEVARWIEDNLLGEVMSGVRVKCSPEWFDALTSHATVKAAFSGYQEASQRLGGDMRKGFTFGGITFDEYRGNATDTAGNVQKFIPADTARAYPVGTLDTFQTYAAPADFNETVGTIGQLYYAKIEPRKMGRGYDAHTQSNPLPLVKRPKLLVKLTKS